MLQSNDVRVAALEHLRGKALAEPQEPAADQRSMFKACGKAEAVSIATSSPPQWLRLLFQNRDEFGKCALLCGDPQQGDSAYMLLYAS